MATSRQLIETVAACGIRALPRVVQHARQLREDGVIPASTGARIAQVDVQHATPLMIASLLDKDVKDATRLAEAYCGLRLEGDPHLTLGTFLAHELDLVLEGKSLVQAVHLIHEPHAAMVYHDDLVTGEEVTLRFAEDGQWPVLKSWTTSILHRDSFEAIARCLDY